MPRGIYTRTMSYKGAVEKHSALNGTTIQEDLTMTPVHDESDDVVDYVPDDFSFTWFDFSVTFGSIATFLFDVVSDIAVAVSHYGDGNMWYFGLTVAFIVVPMVIMTGFSLRWYLIDAKLKKKGAPVFSARKWAIIGILLVFQLTPLLRYATILEYAWKARNVKDKEERRKYNRWLVYEDADASLLRLFESFLESAPQVLLQLYILATPRKTLDMQTVFIQVFSMVTSVISLAWAVVAQHTALRISNPKSRNMNRQGQIFQFLWRLFDIIARILALGLFVSIYQVYLAYICLARWLIMSLWIISMKTDFCTKKAEEVAYNFILGGVFIFCYFNPKGGATRWRYVIYYSYTFVENTVLMSVWYTVRTYSDPSLWYLLPAMYGHFLSFLLALFFMVTYYVLFHPNGNLLTKMVLESKEVNIDKNTEVKLIQQKPLPIDEEEEEPHEKAKTEYQHIVTQYEGETGTPV